MVRDVSLTELEKLFDELDKDLPEWFRELRKKARKIFREKEERGEPVGKFGKDFNLLEYSLISQPKRSRQSLTELSDDERKSVESIGIDTEEKGVSGTHLQEDAFTTYRKVLSQKGVILEPIEEAVRKYSWLAKFVHRLVPLDLDKYTAFCSGYSRGGVLIWAREGVRINLPIQACFLFETNEFAQLPYVLVVAEPESRINVLSGCVVHPRCMKGLHGSVTEIYVGRGAEVTFNLIHNFPPGFHIRPKVGVSVEEGGTYVENYLEIGTPESVQLFPTVVLRGEKSRAELRSFFFGRKHSEMDVGGGIIFTGYESRGEIISRTVVVDEAKVYLRGALKAYATNARGHLDCRSLLLSEKAEVKTFPNLSSHNPNCILTHEAAVGKIEEEQLYYLMSRGLSKEEAISLIVRGFLDIAHGMPPSLQGWVRQLVYNTAKEVM